MYKGTSIDFCIIAKFNFFFFETDSQVSDNISIHPPQEKKLGYGVWRSGIGIVYRGQKEITYKITQYSTQPHTAPIKDINNTHPSGINSYNLYYSLSI